MSMTCILVEGSTIPLRKGLNRSILLPQSKTTQSTSNPSLEELLCDTVLKVDKETLVWSLVPDSCIQLPLLFLCLTRKAWLATPATTHSLQFSPPWVSHLCKWRHHLPFLTPQTIIKLTDSFSPQMSPKPAHSSPSRLLSPIATALSPLIWTIKDLFLVFLFPLLPFYTLNKAA